MLGYNIYTVQYTEMPTVHVHIFFVHSPLGQRAHDLGVVTDKGRTDTVHLNVVTYKLYEAKH